LDGAGLDHAAARADDRTFGTAELFEQPVDCRGRGGKASPTGSTSAAGW